MQPEQASFVIVGAGAVGTVLAGCLARAAHRVTLITRPSYVAQMNDGLLRVFGISDFEVRVQVAGELHEGSPDYLILAVKTPDTEGALAAVQGLAPKTVLSLQNGLAKDQILSKVFGREKVLGATSIIGASMVQPGVAEHTFNGATLLGELEGAPSERAMRLADILSWAGLRAEVTDNIGAAEWSKLCQYAPAALVSVLSRLPYYQICLSEPLAEVFVQLTRECAAVATACGSEVGDYPGFNIKSLVEVSESEAVRSIVERGEDMERRGMTGMRISMLQDVERGHPTELEETIGDVVRRGAEANVPVPWMRLGYLVVRGIEANWRRPTR